MLSLKRFYFAEKFEIIGKKLWLAGTRNPIIGKLIVLKEGEGGERRPHHNYVKLQSQNLLETKRSHFRSIPLKSLSAVEDIKDRAVKKQRYSKSSERVLYKNTHVSGDNV